jgi:hypothetical protein
VVDGLDEEFGAFHQVRVAGAEELGGLGAEGVLGGRGDRVGLLAAAGDVAEQEGDAGAEADGVEEVASGAIGVVAGVDVESVDQAEMRRHGLFPCSGRRVRVGHGSLRICAKGVPRLSEVRRIAKQGIAGPRYNYGDSGLCPE